MNPTEPKTDPAASAVGEVAFLLETGRVADAAKLAARLVEQHPDSPAARAAFEEARQALAAVPRGGDPARGGDMDPMDLASLDEEVADLHQGALSDPGGPPLEELEHSLDFETFSIPKARGVAPSAPPASAEILHAPAARKAEPPPAAAGPRESNPEIAALLMEAEGNLAAGRVDEAIAVASRIQVIQADHARAQEIVDEARVRRDRGARELEDMLYEAQRCLDRKEWSGAKNYLSEVLARRPDHEEARDLLDDVEKLLLSEDTGAASAAAGALKLGTKPPAPGTGALPPLPGHAGAEGDGLSAVPLAPRAGDQDEIIRPQKREHSSRGSSSKASAKKPRKGMSLGIKVLIGIVVMLALAAGGVWYVIGNRRDQLRAARGTNSQAGKKPGKAAAGTSGDASAQDAAKAAGKTAGAAGPGAAAKLDPKAAFAEGRKALADGRLDVAVTALELAVQGDPTNGEAVDLLKNAREALGKQQQAERDLGEAKRAFTEKRYDDSLRLLYRLPETIQKGDLARAQRNAWFNLAINSLMAGDTVKAIENLEEALGLDPTDARAAKEKKFAQTYSTREKDAVYYKYAESIAPRAFDEK